MFDKEKLKDLVIYDKYVAGDDGKDDHEYILKMNAAQFSSLYQTLKAMEEVKEANRELRKRNEELYETSVSILSNQIRRDLFTRR